MINDSNIAILEGKIFKLSQGWYYICYKNKGTSICGGPYSDREEAYKYLIRHENEK